MTTASAIRRVTAQALVLEMGRVSEISTTSPTFRPLSSTWAWYFLDLATILRWSYLCYAYRFHCIRF